MYMATCGLFLGADLLETCLPAESKLTSSGANFSSHAGQRGRHMNGLHQAKSHQARTPYKSWVAKWGKVGWNVLHSGWIRKHLWLGTVVPCRDDSIAGHLQAILGIPAKDPARQKLGYCF